MRPHIFSVLFLCLCLLSCATDKNGADDTSLPIPRGFIGLWDYHAAYDTLFAIQPDGTIEVRVKSTNEPEETYEYRVIHVVSPRQVYILKKQKTINGRKPYAYSYNYLSIHAYYDKNSPETINWRTICYTDSTDWEMPRLTLERAHVLDPPEDKCDITDHRGPGMHHDRYKK